MNKNTSIPALNPTLWRTCRMLASPTRINLLRALVTHPGQGVSALGQCVGIRQSAASQELRRIQSRGIIQPHRKGTRLIYRLGADPQVSSAAPLLKAISSALNQFPPARDEEMCVLATGLAHERRIRMFRHLLLNGPCTPNALAFELRITRTTFSAHLHTLQAGGWIKKSDELLTATVPNHPLAKALAKLIQQGVTR
ncbi:MAG: MarR family transcriptional regulator [Kiritimatiellia bacterium]|jgi:DNA-binding MarR family transcriptional regulator